MLVRCVDTFAGIGGFRMAADLACRAIGAEFRCVKSVEHNREACDTYKANFGDDPFGDMRSIPPEDFPEHDLLLGGFPCQAFSRNGRIYNFSGHDKAKTLDEDDRANLCFRLFDILREKKPPLFVFENVKEIMTIRNKDGSLFSATLLENFQEHGYDVSPCHLDSSDFGLPQQRRRVYFVGRRMDLKLDYAPPKGIGSEIKFTSAGDDGDTAISDILGEAPSKYLLKNLWKNRMMPGDKSETLDNVACKLRRAGIKPRYLRLLEREIGMGFCRIPRLKALALAYDSGEWEEPRGRTGKIEPVAILYGDTPSGLPRQQDKLYSILGISPTIATFSTPCVSVHGGMEAWRMLTPRECSRLQGFPDEFRLPERDTLAYKQVGNAISVPVATAVIESLLRAAFSVRKPTKM
jgi:DNA (cytosine-5)-methyltransferase 1